MILLWGKKKALQSLIPQLAVRGAALLKLLPALQHVYGSVVQIKGNFSSLENIALELTSHKKLVPRRGENNPVNKLRSSALVLRDVEFVYPTVKSHVFKNVNLDVFPNSFVGIIGPSGSGKTRLENFIGIS